MENNDTDNGSNNTNTNPDNKPSISLEAVAIATNLNNAPNPIFSENGEGNQSNQNSNQHNNQNNSENNNSQENTDTDTNNTNTNPNDSQVETFEQTIIKFKNETTLSVEDKEFKDLLISTFKGTLIDEKGNLLDKDNVIVLSSDKLKNYLENDELPLDANGNVVNDKGEIIKTKEQVLADASVIIPLINDIKENFGVSFADDFKPEESNQGIIEIVNESIKQVERNSVINFLDNQPELKAYAQHLALGGNAENYTSSNIDYKNIDIKKLEDTAKLDLIKKSLTAQGNPNPDQITTLLSKAGEEELNKATASAVMFLDTKQTEINKERDTQIVKQQLDVKEATDNFWKEVNTVVTKGAIGNITIPLNKRQAFMDYMSKPINEKGQSQEGIDVEKEGIEQDLLISYLRFNGGKIDTLAMQIARQDKVIGLQQRFTKLKGLSNTTGVSDKGNTNKGGVENVSLENLHKR